MIDLLHKTNTARTKILNLSDKQDKIFEDLLSQILKYKKISVQQESLLLDYCFNSNSLLYDKIQSFLDD